VVLRGENTEAVLPAFGGKTPLTSEGKGGPAVGGKNGRRWVCAGWNLCSAVVDQRCMNSLHIVPFKLRLKGGQFNRSRWGWGSLIEKNERPQRSFRRNHIRILGPPREEEGDSHLSGTGKRFPFLMQKCTKILEAGESVLPPDLEKLLTAEEIVQRNGVGRGYQGGGEVGMTAIEVPPEEKRYEEGEGGMIFEDHFKTSYGTPRNGGEREKKSTVLGIIM